jgi:hypothetical protein
MDLLKKYGKTALIAGASEGLGEAFAKYMAAGGHDLVLVARRADPLRELALSLENSYKIKTLCIPCDLRDENADQIIAGALEGREVSILVYNAASSFIGKFIADPVSDHVQAAQVNMITPVKLVHHFGALMLEKGRGAVILMSSMAGLQGSGYLALYAASKAFLRVLAESLWYEWKDSGTDILACVAGATSTTNYIKTKPEKIGPFSPAVLTPEEVVNECFRNLGRKPSFITGRGNRLASLLMHRLLPRRIAINIMGATTRRMYRL